MPIQHAAQTIRPTQEEFGQIAYEVMNCVYAIHNEFGRLFDEAVYKQELANRLPGMELELPVSVSHGSFSKHYKLDVLAHKSGIFEFKAAESISGKHRGQTLNYLLLFDLPHGKVINVRSERVRAEFVNCRTRLEDLRTPAIHTSDFDSSLQGGSFFHEQVMSLIQDWGSGLDIAVYEEALTHFLGGEEQVMSAVPVIGAKGHLHDQKMRLMAPNIAFKITSLASSLSDYETHLRCLLKHTNLKAIQWANITHQHVTFRTIH